MLEQAVRRRWNIDGATKERVVAALRRIVENPQSSARAVTSASRAIAQMEAQNQADEHKDRPDQVDIRMVDSETLDEYASRYGLGPSRLESAVNGNGHDGNGRH